MCVCVCVCVKEQGMVYILHKYSGDTYEGWNFNSGNYLFTNDTK